MDNETILRRWAASQTPFTEEEIDLVRFEHYGESWTESGTTWPEETTATVSSRVSGAVVTIRCESDIGSLLREILSFASA